MKHLYWIDDDFKQMLHILQGAISGFWKLNDLESEGIASKVLIFGNASKTVDINELPNIQDEKKASQRFFNLFFERCLEHDGTNEKMPTFEARKGLIREPVCYLFKNDISGDLTAYQELKETWISKDITKEEDYQNAQKQAQSLVERMKLESNSVVGIDISLLYDDRKRLLEGKRILSMELCSQIEKLQKNIKYFMYSTEADEDELREKWKQIYNSEYENRKIRIYRRKDFMQKGNSDIVKEVEKMFEINYTEDKGEENGGVGKNE